MIHLQISELSQILIQVGKASVKSIKVNKASICFLPANRELTAVISEIMMYVVITVLQLWMIGVLIYCYKKIYAENEAREAKKAARAQNK